MIAAAVAALAAIGSASAGDPSGTWLTPDRAAKVHIASCGGAMCGSVVWLAQPNDLDTGEPLTDELNIDLGKRGRPILGVPVVLGMQRNGEDNKWWGRLYNPKDGNTYRGSIEIIDAMRLLVRGCVNVYCETEIWTRAIGGASSPFPAQADRAR
jgi:uncharacterized protein (DUF2147 family)